LSYAHEFITGAVLCILSKLRVRDITKAFRFCFSGRFKDDADGAETAVYASLDPNLKGLSRGYFLRPRDKPRWPSKEAR